MEKLRFSIPLDVKNRVPVSTLGPLPDYAGASGASVIPDSIKGWYCKCKVGSRTLGCCSHVAAVVRYLSLDRFESPPNFRDLGASFHDATNELNQDKAQLILEAAEALAQEEDSSDEED